MGNALLKYRARGTGRFLPSQLAAFAVGFRHRAGFERIGGARVRAMQKDRELGPRRFPFRQYRRLEQLVLDVLGQSTPALDDRFSQGAENSFLSLGR